MTTQSWNTVLDHTSDANFRIWGNELKTKLAAAGLVQTADTGQINWASVVRAGTNADAGYEVWRMNDTQQATAPVFIKIYYGTHGSATAPRMRVEIGTGSNGSGTITGNKTTVTNFTGSVAQSSATLWQSYLCVAEGFFGLAWKLGSGSSGSVLFCRTADPAGANAPTAEGGFALIQQTTNFNLLAVWRFAATATYFEKNNASMMPLVTGGDVGSTAVGSDIQVFPFFFGTPRIYPAFAICGAIDSEIPKGTTFSAILIGTTSHTFIGLDNTAGDASPSSASTYKPCMLWE